MVAHRVELVFRFALEVIGAQPRLTLLLMEDAQDVLHRLLPFSVEDRGIARGLPVMVSQSDGVAERVNLVLALVQFGLHVRYVVHPSSLGLRLLVEGVGVGIDVDALQLSPYHAAYHLLHFWVSLGKLYVGPHLCCRIAQPHGMYVSRIYERVLLAVALSGVVMHGGVERVGEAVLKHPCQSGVLTDKTLHLTYLLLYGVRDEKAVSFLRSLAGVACVVRRSNLRIAG